VCLRDATKAKTKMKTKTRVWVWVTVRVRAGVRGRARARVRVRVRVRDTTVHTLLPWRGVAWHATAKCKTRDQGPRPDQDSDQDS
jgi:hypothetical protein